MYRPPAPFTGKEQYADFYKAVTQEEADNDFSEREERIARIESDRRADRPHQNDFERMLLRKQKISGSSR